MELELNRIDYCSVGATLPSCMKLLPGNRAREPQRVVVGDQDGIVQLFSMKKDELIVHFKTLPAEKVQSIHLGGALGNFFFQLFLSEVNLI